MSNFLVQKKVENQILSDTAGKCFFFEIFETEKIRKIDLTKTVFFQDTDRNKNQNDGVCHPVYDVKNTN